MAYQVLARKWRPQNFTQLVGQEHVSQSLCNAVRKDRLHHAYLFTGTRGVGKTTVARIFAKLINCESPKECNPCGECLVCQAFEQGRFLDLIEVDAASRTKVEETRDLLDNVQYAPNQGQYKVYVIDEVHMLSGHSFNALLKTLEEPPPHVKFLLATTDPQKIPVTVLSRCLQFNLKRLLPEQMSAQMTYILGQEKIDFDSDAIKLIARAADGSMRDGLSLLDQAIAFGNGEVRLDAVSSMLGTVAQQPVDDILLALASKQAVVLLHKIADIAELAPDFAEILQQILRVLHRVTLTQSIPGFVDKEFDSDIILQLAKKLLPEEVQLFYQIALVGQDDLALAPNPRIGFEMVLLRMLTFMPDRGVDQKTVTTDVLEKSRNSNVTNVVQEISSVPEYSDMSLDQEAKNSSSWSEMVVAMKIQGMTRELANNCVLENLDDKVCSLILNPAHTQLVSPRAKDKLQQAIQRYYGDAVKLIINMDKTEHSTPAQQSNQQVKDKQQAAELAINADDNVNALKEQFDARVLPGTIEPI